MSEQNFENLLNKIKSHDAHVVIIGLGYVGLPLAVGFARVGLKVTGLDNDPAKIAKLSRGENYILDVESDELRRLIKKGSLKATTDPAVLADADGIIICVPSPLNKTGDPDVSMIMDARDKVAAHLHPGQVIVLESTSYPGTVEELILPSLLERGLKPGEDFYLAFSPERVDPGNKTFKVENTPKVIGGMTPNCTRAACELYGQLVERVVPVSSPAAAEMTKLLENTFRSINIGLANEVAIMCQVLGLDPWEVIGAAATKPFGFMPFYPGPGLGGHCIPIDPSYLSWKLRALKYRTKFIELATEINAGMPEYVVRRAAVALNDDGKAVKGSKILLLGMAYKRDIDDLRESPSLDVMRLLEKQWAVLTYHDPYIAEVREGGVNYHSVELTPVTVSAQDLVIILTDHTAVDYKMVCNSARLVFDARNATKTISNPTARVVKL